MFKATNTGNTHQVARPNKGNARLLMLPGWMLPANASQGRASDVPQKVITERSISNTLPFNTSPHTSEAASGDMFIATRSSQSAV